MVEIPTSTRNLPVGLNRSPLRPGATPATLATPAGDSSIGVSGTARPAHQLPAHLSMSTLGGFKSALLEFRHAAATLAALAKVLVLKSPFTVAAPAADDPPTPGSAQSSTDPDAANPDPRSLFRPTAALSGSALTAASTTTALLRAVQAFVAAHNELSATLHRLTDAADAGETALDHHPTTVDVALVSSRTGAAPAAMSRTVQAHAEIPAGTVQPAGAGDHKTGGLGGNEAAPGAPGPLLRKPPDRLATTISRWPDGDETTPDVPGPSARKLLDSLAAVVSRRSDWSGIGLTPDRAGGLRLDVGRLQAALVAEPRTVARLFSALGAAVDEATPSPSFSPPLTTARASGPATTAPSPAALAEFREMVQVLTRLSRLLVDPAPPTGSLPARGSAPPLTDAAPGQNLPIGPRPALPASTTGQAVPGAPATASPALPSNAIIRPAIPNPDADSATPEIAYLNRRETLLSTALPRPEVRLAALTLQLQAGRTDAATGRFVADPQQPAIHVASGDGDTLAGLRDAISAGDPELGAAVVKDGAGYRLAVRLPEAATTRTVAVSLGKAPIPAMPGDGDGQPLGFTVQRDADAVQTAVQSLVSAYNRLGSAIGSMTGDVQAQTLADSLRQALAGTINHPERIRTLAQAGITVQPDGALLIDPVRLQKAAEAHPRRLLEPFIDPDGDDPEDDQPPSVSTDGLIDRLSDPGDEPDLWNRYLEDQARQPALDPDDGRRTNGGLDVVTARCRARLRMVEQATQQILNSTAYLSQALAQWTGESAALSPDRLSSGPSMADQHMIQCQAVPARRV